LRGGGQTGSQKGQGTEDQEERPLHAGARVADKRIHQEVVKIYHRCLQWIAHPD